MPQKICRNASGNQGIAGSRGCGTEQVRMEKSQIVSGHPSILTKMHNGRWAVVLLSQNGCVSFYFKILACQKLFPRVPPSPQYLHSFWNDIPIRKLLLTYIFSILICFPWLCHSTNSNLHKHWIIK
jgi:hypothetical protein